jgi:hypothetical protein
VYLIWNVLIYIFREEVERLAKEFNMRLYRTSVKEDLNVDDVFQHLAENYVNKVKSFNELEANIGGYPTNTHELPLHHQGGMSHLGNSMGLNVYGTSSSARQLIQIGASSSSITRPYNHNTQRIISVGAPRTNGYYKRNNSTGYHPNNGYTGIGGYNPDYSNQPYSSNNGNSSGHHINGNR